MHLTDIQKAEPEKIRIRTFDDEGKYMQSKPWHHTQKLVEETEKYRDFELELCVTNDFKGKIFSRTDRLEILSPAYLRQDIKTILKRWVELYD